MMCQQGNAIMMETILGISVGEKYENQRGHISREHFLTKEGQILGFQPGETFSIIELGNSDDTLKVDITPNTNDHDSDDIIQSHGGHLENKFPPGNNDAIKVKENRQEQGEKCDLSEKLIQDDWNNENHRQVYHAKSDNYYRSNKVLTYQHFSL